MISNVSPLSPCSHTHLHTAALAVASSTCCHFSTSSRGERQARTCARTWFSSQAVRHSFQWVNWGWMTQCVRSEENIHTLPATEQRWARVAAPRGGTYSLLSVCFHFLTEALNTEDFEMCPQTQHQPCSSGVPVKTVGLLPSPSPGPGGWSAVNRWCWVSPSSSCLCRSSCRCRGKEPRRLPPRRTSRPPHSPGLSLHRACDRRPAPFSPPTRGSSSRPELPLCGKRPSLLLLLLVVVETLLLLLLLWLV